MCIHDGMTVALVGSSGAGKSTLVNALLGEERMARVTVAKEDVMTLVSLILLGLVLPAPRLVATQSPAGVWRITAAVVGGDADGGRHDRDVQSSLAVFTLDSCALAVAGNAQVTKAVEQAADQLIGTWELNVGRSKFSTAPPRSSTRTYEAVPNGLKFTGREIDATGKPVVGQWIAYYDGKDYPTTGSPHSDTISIRRIDSFTGESVQKKAGKVVARNRRVVSSDGKVMTLTAAGTDAQGQPVTNVWVFDRR